MDTKTNKPAVTSKTTPQESKLQTKNHDYGRFDFMGTVYIWGSISALTFVAALILFATKGFNYGIDFAGGTEIQVMFKDQVNMGQVRDFLKTVNLDNAQLQKLGETSEYLIRFENSLAKKKPDGQVDLAATIQFFTNGVKSTFGDGKFEMRRVDSVGPQVGSQLKRNAILALFYSLLAILIYTALRFDYNYAPGAVICLFHDAIVVLGVLVLLGKEINIQVLAAILTIVGYSMNDTIVVYDRIRENLHFHKDKSLAWVINRSINTTMARTMITSFLTFLSVLALFLIAGGVIKEFAFTMGLGIIFGTYSSIYVASPMIILFDRFKTVK